MTLPPYPGGGETPEGEPGKGQPPSGQPPQAPPPPYGQNPYGQGQNPYGQGQWPASGGHGSYRGPNDPTGQSYSGVAIAALALSLTCVLSIVGVILGIVGIFRTGPGKGRGRWMAVTAIVVGLLFTIVLGLIAGLGIWIGKQVISPGNAEAGQCVETDTEDDEVFMWRVGCDDPHHAEIVGRHLLTAAEAGGGIATASRVCERMFRDDFPEAYAAYADGGETLELRVLTEGRRLEAGQHITCYIERRDGATLDERVLD